MSDGGDHGWSAYARIDALMRRAQAHPDPLHGQALTRVLVAMRAALDVAGDEGLSWWQVDGDARTAGAGLPWLADATAREAGLRRLADATAREAGTTQHASVRRVIEAEAEMLVAAAHLWRCGRRALEALGVRDDD